MTDSVKFSRTIAILPLALLAIVAAVVSARAQQPHPQVPKSLRLYVFDCGVIKGLDPALFNFKREEVKSTDFAVPCYLIVDPKGTLMWDVGVIPDTAFKDDGKPVTQGPSTATRTLKSQLAEIGYAPGDITYLAHSHYHGDHIANSNEFAGSTWLVRPIERDAMFADKPPQLVDPKVYDQLKNARTVLITQDEYDVFGDGKVIIKSAPGHTPGHQVVILHLNKTGNVMLAGDLYHYPEERGSGRVPTFEYNKEQSLASRAMIEDYCKRTKTQLWIEHDYLGNAKLKKSPNFYD
ncbi:MAG TPA: N-acyl homoserine lactonase family protein [Candidatus Acidoferrales bacterium]|jgi:N-acyl homoserine lactone hydrolase|nr:N-acyl homoserine lactonase family protein [Candidatus Acidoferrales bacterium]